VFAYIGEFHSQQYRNRAILAAAFISATSAITFPSIAWLTINQTWNLNIPFIDIVYKPWRFYFVACGIPGLLCGLILSFLPESPKYLLSAGQPQKAIEVLHKIHQINTKNHHNYPEFKVIPKQSQKKT